ncbi:MAG: acetyl-CoA carboxylase biotin carboxyl carrier protein subunit [Dehalococcoidia bacterium]
MAVERYRVQVDGRWMELALERKGDRIQVQCGEKRWDADLQQFLDTNLISLLLGGDSLEFLVDRIEDVYSVLRGWEQYQVRVKPAWARAQRPGALESTVPTELTIDSPLVGMVASVAAKRGQQVQRGDLLLVIEAMKMQNEIRAPRDGTVRAIRVTAGQKVAVRQPLVVLA